MLVRCIVSLLLGAGIAAASPAALNGRWVIEGLGGASRALWLEVRGAGTDHITGWMVGGGPGGQLDPIVDARIENGHLYFKLERVIGRERDRKITTSVTAAIHNGRIHGVAVRPNGVQLWVGDRAPAIADRDDGTWEKGPVVHLFDGSGLEGWHTLRLGREEGWYVEKGVLKNRRRADILVSDAKFWNFALEMEYLVHPGMNGGLGLRGRYEIQLLDDFGSPPSSKGNGALYGRIAPSVNASRPANAWQTLEVRLVGREVTVTLNGVKTIDRGEVAGFTAMATDWREGEPGPITLQGDHGAIEYRRISVTPLAQ